MQRRGRVRSLLRRRPKEAHGKKNGTNRRTRGTVHLITEFDKVKDAARHLTDYRHFGRGIQYWRTGCRHDASTIRLADVAARVRRDNPKPLPGLLLVRVPPYHPVHREHLSLLGLRPSLLLGTSDPPQRTFVC